MSATDESGFPRSWRWDEDGRRVEGTFVRMDRGPTEYGQRPIVVLDVGGVERSVWLNTDVVKAKFRDELVRRGGRRFDVGERLSVERAAEKKTSAAGRDYWPFWVKFPDAPA